MTPHPNGSGRPSLSPTVGRGAFNSLPHCWGRVGDGVYPNIIWYKKLSRQP